MLRPSPTLAHRVIEGQAFVMDPRSRRLHSLNGTGTLIWKGLAAGRSVEEIAQGLAESYEVAPQQALRDVSAFLEELRGKGLLVEG